MQDRYAGDIGDYGKFGLLRALSDVGLRIGVNWYATDPSQAEAQGKQNSGGYPIPEKYDCCDPELARALRSISSSESRTILALEAAHFLPGAEYYPEKIDVLHRADWHQAALRQLDGQDVVFLDPDNGFQVKSVRERSKTSTKYVFYREAKDYVSRNQSLIVYQHRNRKKKEVYFREIRDCITAQGIDPAIVSVITFPRYAVRDYFILSNEKHRDVITSALTRFSAGSWGSKGLCTPVRPLGELL